MGEPRKGDVWAAIAVRWRSACRSCGRSSISRETVAHPGIDLTFTTDYWNWAGMAPAFGEQLVGPLDVLGAVGTDSRGFEGPPSAESGRLGRSSLDV